jgi:hypothetical protein
MAPSGTTPHCRTLHTTLIFNFAEFSPSSGFLSSPTGDVLLWIMEAPVGQETPFVHQLGGLTYYFLGYLENIQDTTSEAYHKVPVGSKEVPAL